MLAQQYRFLALLTVLSFILSACQTHVSQPAGSTTAASAARNTISTPGATNTIAPTSVPSATTPATSTPTPAVSSPAIRSTARAATTPAATSSSVPTVALPAPTVVETHLFPVQPINEASYGSCHHDYPASDIFVPIGTRFVAVISGVVEWVTTTDEWEPTIDDPRTRGGLSVAFVGDDGVRYYGSHLSTVADGIAPGGRVARGQVLGLTGNTGNARPGDPQLHFGISAPTTPDDWATRRGTINPYPYLNQWRDGVDATPDIFRANGGAC